jgi:hypothetical protein
LLVLTGQLKQGGDHVVGARVLFDMPAFLKTDEAYGYWLKKVLGIASVYEQRWTRLALKSVDPQLAAELAEQESMFDAACQSGTVSEIETQGTALCRRWIEAIRAMEKDAASDGGWVGDCLIGIDLQTGTKVAILRENTAAACARAVELLGDDVHITTPDDVARLIASVKKAMAER